MSCSREPKKVATAVATAAGPASGGIHLAAVLDRQLWHRVRHEDGSWGSWERVGSPGSASGVAAATDPATGALHLAAVLNGKVWHRIRTVTGTWTAWEQVAVPGTAVALGATVDGGALHLTVAAQP